MSAQKSMARVAIVGPANVGKSSLFNQLAGRRLAIVENRPGVTRDRLETQVALSPDHAIALMDTGGMDIPESKNFSLEEPLQKALELADVFIFVIDVRLTLGAKEEKVAQYLRQTGKPVILLCNKADTETFAERAVDYWKLGLGEPKPYSVHEKMGLQDLLETLMEMTPQVAPDPNQNLPRVAIVGRRNSGKSTLLNFLSRESRVIVSSQAGTTSDFVETRIEAYGRPFFAIDTAGLKKPHWQDTVDFFSNKRTERILRECDAVLFLLEAPEKISTVDKKIASTLRRLCKPLVIGLNKWDLVPDEISPQEHLDYVDAQLWGLPYAPIVVMSGLHGNRVRSLVKTLFEVIDQGNKRIDTGPLNRLVEQAVSQRPPPVTHGRRASFLYATQVGVSPPTFIFKVNDGRLITKNYRRYLENSLREGLKIPEVPIKIVFRGKPEKGQGVTKK